MKIKTIEDYLKRQTYVGRLEGGLRVTKGIHKQSEVNRPLVSIITVVYNAERFLDATIQSVINQTYENKEYIIIDGGSDDNTLDIIKKYEEFIDCWISEPDRGIYDAMNKGISLCSGSIIGLINSGDIYTKDAVLSCVQEYIRTNEPSILIGDCKALLSELSNKWLIYSGNPSYLPYKMLPHPSVFVPLSVYQANGLFDTNFKIASDYDFLCRCYTNGVKFTHINQVLAIANPRGVSIDYYLTETEFLKIRIRHNLPFLRSVSISALSFLSITVHKILEHLNLWQFIEVWRHGSIR